MKYLLEMLYMYAMVTRASPNPKYIIDSLMKLKKFMLMIIHVVWLQYASTK